MLDVEVAAVAPRGGRLVGRNVALRPVTPEDYGILYEAEHSEALGPRWRMQGGTVQPEAYPQTLWRGVAAQFVVMEPGSPRPIGLVSLHNVEATDRVAQFSIADLGVGGRPTRVAQGAFLFLAYVFATWPFRKLYAHAMEYNLGQYTSMLGRMVVEEGRLRDHHYLEDRYWDEVILALYRDTWRRWEAKVLPGLLPPSTLGTADDGTSNGEGR